MLGHCSVHPRVEDSLTHKNVVLCGESAVATIQAKPIFPVEHWLVSVCGQWSSSEQAVLPVCGIFAVSESVLAVSVSCIVSWCFRK